MMHPAWYRAALTAALVAGLSLVALGAKVESWYQNTAADFEKGSFSQTVVNTQGHLRLARRLEPLATIDAANTWRLAQGPDGSLYAATGNEGKLFKIAPDGKSAVLYKGDEKQLFSVVVAPDGTVYAGTGPSGLVVKVAADGKASVLYDSPASYIWDLVLDPKGNLYAASGPQGQVFKIGPDGKAQVFYDAKQEHVMALALASDGTLYAGTDREGLVYRIAPDGKAFVLFDAPQDEIRGLLLGDGGVLYAATSSAGRARMFPSLPTPSLTPRDATKQDSSSRSPADLKDDDDVDRDAARPKTTQAPAKPKAAEKPSGAAQRVSTGRSGPARPAPGENSLYRIDPDGSVRELLRQPALMLALARRRDQILVGTGQQARLIEVDESRREHTPLARLDQAEVLSMLGRADGSVVVGTGNPAKLYALAEHFAAEGTYLSPILDAGLISRWGAIRWTADSPEGTGVSMAVRTGNVEEPDDTWSSWSAEQTDPQKATAYASPAARFLQYRATLKAGRPAVTPSLRNVSIRFMTNNQAPVVTKIDIPNADAVERKTREDKLKLKWDANDPNGDDLSYTVHFRKESWQTWVKLAENLEKAEYEWDISSVPHGFYQIRVEASDRLNNPPERALAASRTSDPFVVDHEEPAVTVKAGEEKQAQLAVEAYATDRHSRLVRAAYSVDSKPWVNLFPEDGLFDSTSEKFVFKTDALLAGTHVLVVRATDAAGNTGSGDAVFTAKGTPPATAALAPAGGSLSIRLVADAQGRLAKLQLGDQDLADVAALSAALRRRQTDSGEAAATSVTITSDAGVALQDVLTVMQVVRDHKVSRIQMQISSQTVQPTDQ